MNVKRIIAMAVLLFASRLAAQSRAADPNAIDFSGKMDTIIAKSFVQNLNAGLLNADAYQDFFIGIGTDGPQLIHYGGPFILSDPGFYNRCRSSRNSCGPHRKWQKRRNYQLAAIPQRFGGIPILR